MRETRSSGSVEGVMGNHDSYSDCAVSLVASTTKPTIPSKGRPFIMRSRLSPQGLKALGITMRMTFATPEVVP